MRPTKNLAAGLGLLVLAGSVAAIAMGPALVVGSDHLDAPLVKDDGRIDITDVYAFRDAPTSMALVLNVNPLVAPADTKLAQFRPDALYEIKLDVNLDGLADVAYRIQFSAVHTFADGAVYQSYTIRRAVGAAARTHSFDGLLLGTGQTTLYGHSNQIKKLFGGGSAFAGSRDDPFFFDLVGFKHFKARLVAGSTAVGAPGETVNCALPDTDPAAHLLACFTGTDTFAGTNITSIVLSIPDIYLSGSGKTIGVWGTTSIRTSSGYQQIDRAGRPAINTVFNFTDGQKEQTNLLSPADDRATLGANTRAVLDAIGNVLTTNALTAYTSAQKAALVNVLLPDELTVQVGNVAPFLNGRRLQDDVIDAEFSLLTNGHITSDGVNANDATFSASFPYLAAPH